VIMIITIDGPAGAGKSSVAKRLAQRLGFQFLDTGLMYRAIAWALTDQKVDLEDHAGVLRALPRIRVQFHGEQATVNGRDVTRFLRSPQVSQQASIVAAIPAVREELVQIIRMLLQLPPPIAGELPSPGPADMAPQPAKTEDNT